MSSARICWTDLPRVSGTLEKTKMANGTRTAAKGKKHSPPRAEASGRKSRPHTKLASQLHAAAKAEPEATLSAGKSSACARGVGVAW